MFWLKKQPAPQTDSITVDAVPKKPRLRWLGETDPIAGYTLALVIVAIVQAVVAALQWSEIRSGSDDTKALVLANQNQLRVMQAEQRPWVSAGIGISSPLEFKPDAGAFIGIQYTIRNTGKSPALNTHFRSKLVALRYSKFIHEEIIDSQNALCDPLRNTDQYILNITVFPGDAITGSESVGITKEGLSFALAAREFGRFAHKGYISLAVVACIDYQLPFEAGHHQTRYAFELGVPLDSGPFMADLKPEGARPDVNLIYFNQSAD